MFIDPHLIFQNPETYLEYLISANPEGQYFDRKEVRNDDDKKMGEARQSLVECVSAFSNSRGGITVLGINNSGELKGLDHLSENECNSLSNVIYEQLNNHQSITREWHYEHKKFLLVYSPQGRSGICKTVRRESPKGWIRNNANNIPLTSEQEARLIVERNTSFEQLSAIEFQISLINKEVLDIFKKRYLEEHGAEYTYSDEDFLKSIVAIKSENNNQMLTNAGLLFFGSNPVGLIPSAHIRFLKYEVEYRDFAQRGTPTFDRSYDGCLPVLLQKIRTFIKEGAFFKTYTYRNPHQSGIIDEPELPLNAVEEAIVNAIIHRDYNMPIPIECSLFKDAFVVRSPGSLRQPEFIPTSFSLEETELISYPRNPGIVQWAKTMKDESGQRFVKALSEGSRTMRDSMKQLGLPAPVYNTNGFTNVILYNNYREREARIKRMQQPLSQEFTNLFPLDVEYRSEDDEFSDNKSVNRNVLNLIKDKLQNLGWFIDRDKASRITAHIRGHHISLDAKVNQWIRIFPAFTFQIYSFGNQSYLSIDFDIQLKNFATLDQLYTKGISDLRYRSAQVKFGGSWTHGIIQDCTAHYARVVLPEYDRTEELLTTNVIPSLSKKELSAITHIVSPRFNLDAKIKELSLSSQFNASKQRVEKIIDTANYISREVFPLSYNDFTVYMKNIPVSLIPGSSNENDIKIFTVVHSLKEPDVKFAENATDVNILSGLAKFGSYSSPNKDIQIIPFCVSGFENKMHLLIERIQKGSMNFKGLERTFKVGIKHMPVISKDDSNDFLHECKRIIHEYDMAGNPDLKNLFLIHIPEDKYPITDIRSPYYTLKQYLLEEGLPVQMIDTPTLEDPKFKDFNLALNIVAKTGGTPWVLPNALPDADFFIGLSYAQYKDDNQLYRTMAYANVFNRYGQWQYYQGNIAAFNFEDKHIELSILVRETLEKIQSLPESPSIHIHYSSKFSRLDRDFIMNSVLAIRPRAIVTFVWINTSHNIRMFDNKIEGNGSLSRGSYVVTSRHQFYLSTTGYSTLKKTLGTPLMLEVNVRNEPAPAGQNIGYRVIAQHLLALSKLNWASTQSINGEPVTTKYAHDIARLSQVFFRNNGQFKLHKVLERTPWFI
jgi:predicted HTH transcriptional regulator